MRTWANVHVSNKNQGSLHKLRREGVYTYRQESCHGQVKLKAKSKINHKTNNAIPPNYIVIIEVN